MRAHGRRDAGWAGGLALLDSTSVGTLVLPLVLLAGMTRLLDVAGGAAPTRLERWWASAAGEHATARATVTLALGAALVEAASMLPYLAAVGIITTADVCAPAALAVLVGYVVVMLAPAGVLLLARTAAGDRLARPLTWAREWLRARTAGALGTVVGLAGLLLLLDAVRVLGGHGLLWW